MVKYSDAELDAVFAALADSTRRGILESLSRGDLAVSELAAPYEMSLPGFMKHLRVLEEAGLVSRSKEGRVVSCALEAGPMKEASVWMSRYEKFWTERLDALGRYLYHQQELTPWQAMQSRIGRRLRSRGTTRPRRKRSGAR